MKELVNTQLCGARRLRVDLRWKKKRKRKNRGVVVLSQEHVNGSTPSCPIRIC